MIFRDEHKMSLWPKFLFTAVIMSTIFVVGWLMFGHGEAIPDWLRGYRIRGDLVRRIILLCCMIIYVGRLLITLFVFIRRKLVWTETIVFTIGIPFALFALTRLGGGSPRPVGVVEIIGMLLYLVGSYVNTRADWSRHIWKKRSENRGRLYTEGLFKYSMHINYFGDVVLFTGFAMITGTVGLLIIPLIMALNFVLISIPSLDRYLANKYGEEFEEYAGRTKKLIPLVY